jgi:FkbM family methyltransferase
MQTWREAVRAFVGLPSPSDTRNSLADLTKAITELRETQIEQTKLINALTRTAAGRGTVWIGDNRIVTRMSLPDMFYDDPLFILNANDVQLLPPLIRDGYYERNSTYYVCRRVHGAQLCIDVGANIGYYTVVMARQAPDAEIIALEPNPVTYELLTANINLNWLTPRCRPLLKGASDKPETLRMAYQTTHLVNAQIVDADRHVAFHSDCQAEFTTIDELTEPYGYKCDFIKTDTEGYEPKVLAGMQRTLDHSPNLSIMMEWSPEQIKQVGISVSAFCTDLVDRRFRLHVIGDLGALSEVPISDLRSLPYQNIVLQQHNHVL